MILKWSKKMRYVLLENINSTQNYLKEQLKNGYNNIVVKADTQFLGHGRNGRQWVSPLGGLWFSFDTEFCSDMITLIVGVAVREACEETFGCKLMLKWPNDLLLNDKKVAGIICEKINDRVVVGVGINTNIKKIEVENSISFLEVTGNYIDNEELMKEVIQKYYYFCKDINKVIDEFRKNMAFVGEEKYISNINKKAKIIGISDNGHLIIEDDGNTKEVFVGEIFN